MSKSNRVTYNFHGPVASMATGDHSAAQSGVGHVANIGHQEHADLSALMPLFAELTAAITTLSSQSQRDELSTPLALASSEIAKGAHAKPSVVKRAFDAMSVVANVGSIGDLLAKGYGLLMPFLEVAS